MVTELFPRRSAPRRAGAGIQSVAKAIDVLLYLGHRNTPTSVTELCRHLHMHKSTVSRLLLTLENGGLVAYDESTGYYRLGLGLLEIAGLALEGFDVRSVAQTHLLVLAQESRETVNLGVLDHDAVTNIAQILSPETIKHVGWIGRRNPLYCTSGGRLFLAFGPETIRERVLRGSLEARTPATITDPAALAAELRRIRTEGYALVRDEFETDVTAVAAPIFNRAGEIVAVCNATGPTFRFPEEVVPIRCAQVREAAKRISHDLGFILTAPGGGRRELSPDHEYSRPDGAHG